MYESLDRIKTFRSLKLSVKPSRYAEKRTDLSQEPNFRTISEPGELLSEARKNVNQSHQISFKMLDKCKESSVSTKKGDNFLDNKKIPKSLCGDISETSDNEKLLGSSLYKGSKSEGQLVSSEDGKQYSKGQEDLSGEIKGSREGQDEGMESGEGQDGSSGEGMETNEGHGGSAGEGEESGEGQNGSAGEGKDSNEGHDGSSGEDKESDDDDGSLGKDDENDVEKCSLDASSGEEDCKSDVCNSNEKNCSSGESFCKCGNCFASDCSSGIETHLLGECDVEKRNSTSTDRGGEGKYDLSGEDEKKGKCSLVDKGSENNTNKDNSSGENEVKEKNEDVRSFFERPFRIFREVTSKFSDTEQVSLIATKEPKHENEASKTKQATSVPTVVPKKENKDSNIFNHQQTASSSTHVDVVNRTNSTNYYKSWYEKGYKGKGKMPISAQYRYRKGTSNKPSNQKTTAYVSFLNDDKAKPDSTYKMSYIKQGENFEIFGNKTSASSQEQVVPNIIPRKTPLEQHRLSQATPMPALSLPLPSFLSSNYPRSISFRDSNHTSVPSSAFEDAWNAIYHINTGSKLEENAHPHCQKSSENQNKKPQTKQETCKPPQLLSNASTLPSTGNVIDFSCNKESLREDLDSNVQIIKEKLASKSINEKCKNSAIKHFKKKILKNYETDNPSGVSQQNALILPYASITNSSSSQEKTKSSKNEIATKVISKTSPDLVDVVNTSKDHENSNYSVPHLQTVVCRKSPSQMPGPALPQKAIPETTGSLNLIAVNLSVHKRRRPSELDTQFKRIRIDNLYEGQSQMSYNQKMENSTEVCKNSTRKPLRTSDSNERNSTGSNGGDSNIKSVNFSPHNYKENQDSDEKENMILD